MLLRKSKIYPYYASSPGAMINTHWLKLQLNLSKWPPLLSKQPVLSMQVLISRKRQICIKQALS